MSSYAESQIARANAILDDLAEKHADLIPVNIYSAFSAYEEKPVIGLCSMQLSADEEVIFYDPHPDEEGQRLIAKTVFDAMEKQAEKPAPQTEPAE